MRLTNKPSYHGKYKREEGEYYDGNGEEDDGCEDVTEEVVECTNDETPICEDNTQERNGKN